MNRTWEMDLQLFADGGDGSAAAVADGSQTGVNAADAGLPTRKRRENPLANVQYGIQPQTMAQGASQTATGTAEAAQQDTDSQSRRPDFEELINGEYKQDFDARVQAIIKNRLKGREAQEEQQRRLQPLLEALGRKYNVDPTDVDRLAAVIGDDDSLYEDEAMERGVSVETLKAIKHLESENMAMKEREQQSLQEMRMREHFSRLAQQADEARQLYPSLDLRQEMNNPTFARLTAPGVDIDVRTAYEIVHREEMRGAEMQFAAQKSAERMANAIRSGSQRPIENGLNASQSDRIVKTDPRAFTKADREEIRRRVRNNEKIVL